MKFLLLLETTKFWCSCVYAWDPNSVSFYGKFECLALKKNVSLMKYLRESMFPYETFITEWDYSRYTL